jgi:hypothetical protein
MPLLRTCVCASQKSLFRRKAFATQYKSGQRKLTVANQRYCTGVSNSHGGLMPRRSRLRVRLTASIVRFSSATVRATHHGGLTPAALVNMRLCIAKGVISPATGRRARRQERGASAPRRVQSVSERETRKVIAWQSQTRFGKPRRADARRSCERAFVHCKRRYFSGQRTPCSAPGAGGVSPPWETSAVANRKRTSRAICRACNQERGV